MLKSLGSIPSTSKKEERKGGRVGETEGTEGDDKRGERRGIFVGGLFLFL